MGGGVREHPRNFFGVRGREKGGFFPPHFGVLPAPKIRNSVRSTFSRSESYSIRSGERDGERPRELGVSGGVHLQRA